MLTDETRWLSLYLLYALHSDKTGQMNLSVQKDIQESNQAERRASYWLSLTGGRVPDSPETSSEAASGTWTDASGTSEDVRIRRVWFLYGEVGRNMGEKFQRHFIIQ